MNTRNWIIAAVAVVLLIAIYFVVFQPGAEAHGNHSAACNYRASPGSVMSGRAPDTGNGGGRFSCRDRCLNRRHRCRSMQSAKRISGVITGGNWSRSIPVAPFDFGVKIAGVVGGTIMSNTDRYSPRVSLIPAKTFFIAALCGVAVSALPFDLGNGSFGTSGAYAKNGGNGGGNGNGGGKAAVAATAMATARRRQQGSGGGGNRFGWKCAPEIDLRGKKRAPPRKSPQGPPQKLRKGRRQSLGVVQEVAPVPREKNLNAKLGRLNSLKRNVNAYINSKSPKFAAVQAFVCFGGSRPRPGCGGRGERSGQPPAGRELDALNAELGALTGLPPAATPEEQAAREAQIAELNAQITEQQAFMPLPPL